MTIDIEKIAAFATKNAAELNELQQNLTVKGEAGKGLVKLVLNGEHEIEDLYLAPELLKKHTADEISRLIISAYTRAQDNLEDAFKEATLKMAGKHGVNLRDLAEKK